ncbi:hypothetical protein D9M71_828480 [compost metagenome]
MALLRVMVLLASMARLPSPVSLACSSSPPAGAPSPDKVVVCPACSASWVNR